MKKWLVKLPKWELHGFCEGKKKKRFRQTGLSKSKGLLVTLNCIEEPPQLAGYTGQVSVQTGLQEEFHIPVCILHLEMLIKSHVFSKVFSVYNQTLGGV